MIAKNLLRRKGRTLLTVLGVGIGVAAIIALGALADGIDSGYRSMLSGSQADLVLSQVNALDISLSSIDDSIETQLQAMPEVERVSGMIQGFVQADAIPLFFLFGYPENSFILERFHIIEGLSLSDREARFSRGTPLILGATAAETLNKSVGDSVFLGNSAFRIIGLYETGDTFEDSGAILRLSDAQEVLGKPHQVSLFYIQLKDPHLRDRIITRGERLWSDLSFSSTEEFADRQIMGDALKGYVWVIAGLAIVIGGVSMMNAQLMSVIERTREIGALRAMGWKRSRILWMILGESLVVGLLGAVVGIFLGWLILVGYSGIAAVFGSSAANIRPYIIQQAIGVVLILGLVGGLYPAWRAARLQPIEALRYEGGTSSARTRRLPLGGMAIQSLWQRSSRTFLTLAVIGLTVGAILALQATIVGVLDSMTELMGGGDAEIVIRQADIADTSLSAIDQRVSEQIASLEEVLSVSGMVLSVASVPEAPLFIIQGYEPYSYALQRITPLEGTRLTGNHQILLGKSIASSLKKEVGDTLEISGTRYRVVGIFETGQIWEEMGGIISLRDAQIQAGRPRKSTLLIVKLVDPRAAPEVRDRINTMFPEIHAALTGEFVEQMPDVENMDLMMNAITILAVSVGGIGVMNTMLMAVLERTREIGVLRALGWRRWRILRLIMNEALTLGLLGGIAGILIAFSFTVLFTSTPLVGEGLTPIWELDSFLRAFFAAVFLGLIGGFYPAYRATRLQPIEALRYE